jgi:hypothetical protein
MNKFISINLVALLLLILITSKNVYKNTTIPTCDNYITNVYLYLLIWIELSAIITYYYMLHPINLQNINPLIFYFILFLELGMLILFHFIPPEQQILKHLIAILFVSIGSFTFGNIMKVFNLSNDIILSLLMNTLLIFAVMSYFGFKYKDKITKKFFIIYAIILICYLLFEIVMSFFLQFGGRNQKIITFIGLILLSIWILFKTKSLVKESETCKFPDYVTSSLSFFITLKNIFMRLLMLKSKR